MKIVKTFVSLMIICAMAFSLAACGGAPSEPSLESSSESGSSSSSESSSELGSSSSSEDEPIIEDEQLSEEEYMQKMEDVAAAMVELQSSAENTTDEEAAKQLLEDLKVQFNDLAQLNAPDAYKDAQEKIKSGSEAMIKYIDLALRAADGEEISADEQSEMMEYITTAMTDLQAGMTEIDGDSPSEPLSEDMSSDEEAYIKRIAEVGIAMTELQNSAASATDVEGAKQLLEDLRTQFSDLAYLDAPDKYKDAQEKIKSGSEAMVKYIDIALKAADGAELSADDQSKMMEYITTAMTDLQAGMAAIQG